jgi:phenylethanolamine N-methyltransferase
MSDPMRQPDPYLSAWDPQGYLRQYYSTPYIPTDSQAVLQFLIDLLSRRAAPCRRAVDFGCGPALYSAIALAPYVQELHLADYLPANLREVQRWLNDEPGAHDWDVYFRGILELETGQKPTAEQVAARKAELRRKITVLREADIRQPHPLGLPQTYDLVVSCFCVEAVSPNRRDWETFLGHLSSLVPTGGTIAMAAVQRCNGYQAARVDESDFARVLSRLGFSEAKMIIRSVPIAEWVDEGFDSICLIAATKGATNSPNSGQSG